MKQTLLLLILIATTLVSSSQGERKKGVSELPEFKIMQTSGVYLQKKDLPANKPLVVIYFSPNCDHCIVLMDQLFPRINEFKRASLLFVTFVNTQELLPFEKKYNTLSHPNIFVGSEGLAYTLKKFYKLEKTPFTALYNKQGKLVASYKKETPLNELLTMLKKV